MEENELPRVLRNAPPALSLASQSITEYVSTQRENRLPIDSAADYVPPTQSMSLRQAEAMRTVYLGLMDINGGWVQQQNEEGFNLTKSGLEEIALQIRGASEYQLPDDLSTFNVRLGEVGRVFPAHKIVTVGTIPYNDICLQSIDDPHSHGSRLHFFIMATMTVNGPRLKIIDVGSLTGVKMLYRSSESSSMESSLPNERRAITIGYEETCVLKAGSFTMIVNVPENATECRICGILPRLIRFNCGHLVACHECAPRLGNSCPMCRAEIQHNGARYDALNAATFEVKQKGNVARQAGNSGM